MDKINLGVIGCGHIASEVLVPSAASLKQFDMHTFADVERDRAKALSQKYPGSSYTTHASKIMKDSAIDAVLICTLPDSHTPLAIEALAAGKHVFLQKPVSVTYEQCTELVHAERAAKSKLMAGYCYRLSPLTRRAKEAIGIPSVISARMMVADIETTHGHYIGKPEMGEPMLELACHNVDMAYWLADAVPMRVFASGGNLNHPDLDIVDTLCMNIEFRSGTIATLTNMDSGADDFSRKWYAELYGNGMTATIDGFRSLAIRGARNEDFSVEYNTGIGIDRDMEVFRDIILDNNPSRIPAEEGVVATVLMLKAFESLKTGEPADVNLEHYLF